jgi:hypothetical protein
MSDLAVKRNANRYNRQIWDYIDSQLADGKTVSTGVIFPKRPKSERRLDAIEKLFEDEGIPVVWQDET